MGVARFAGLNFRIDPRSVRWNFETKSNDFASVGGKVIQIYGTKISDMIVEGEFGLGGWQQQLDFLQRMKDLASAQARAGKVSNSQIPPARFSYPPRKWDFLVYLKAYDNPRGGKAVRHHNEEVNPAWRLTLFIVEDMSELGVKKVAQDAYVSRLSQGLGWKRSLYNGPYGNEMVDSTIKGEEGGPQ